MTEPTDELVRERRGHILVLRLNRPEAHNMLTHTMMRAIGAAMAEADADPETRVVVLTGTGDRTFCAGLDLRSFAEGKNPGRNTDGALDGYMRFMEGRMDTPLIGAANGRALGGGFELLLACDLIVAAENARLALPEVKRGLFPAGGGTSLGTRIPMSTALEIVLTGEPIDADRAHQLGLVNAVVPAGDVLTAALALAERIAANAPLGVAAAKHLVRLTIADAAKAAVRMNELQPAVYASEDAKEGATAFVERRQPVWKGR